LGRKKLARKRLEKSSGISTLLLVGVVVAVILVAGVAAYVFMNQNPAPSQSPEPTSTPQVTNAPSQSAMGTATSQPTSQAAATASPTSLLTQNVSGANSLQFTVSTTSNGVFEGSRTLYGKDIGTDNFRLRIESTGTDFSQTIDIAYGGKAWIYMDNEWSDWGGGINQQMRCNILRSLWQQHVDALSGWSGIGEYSYSQGEKTFQISNISVDPSLADSLFEHGSTP
jgi:hypothetical protein